MTIRQITQISSDTIQQLDSLLHRLSPSAGKIDAERVSDLVMNGRMMIFIAEDDLGSIVGMLTLTCCPTLAYDKYWIEDVVVDESCRGKGLGRSLVRAALSHLRAKEKSPVVYLTSNPSRVAARNLYVSEGFQEYETGVFRII